MIHVDHYVSGPIHWLFMRVLTRNFLLEKIPWEVCGISITVNEWVWDRGLDNALFSFYLIAKYSGNSKYFIKPRRKSSEPRHAKTGLKIFVIVIPKEDLADNSLAKPSHNYLSTIYQSIILSSARGRGLQ